MTVCNSCRYCEGLCAVFPAMEMRRAFPDGDLHYLANLCHGCGACYVDCQFSPPHEFDVNVPHDLAKVRARLVRAYAWPRASPAVRAQRPRGHPDRRARASRSSSSASSPSTIPAVMFAVHTGPGAFYRLMPHNAMVAIFGVAFLYALVALVMGFRAFWRDIGRGQPPSRARFWQAVKDATRLRYLDGGGAGCFNEDERPTDRRRLYHHLTFYGFLLCFASTSVATVYHYVVGRQAPYPWYDLPVVLGTLGGIGLVIGPAGLLAAKWRRAPGRCRTRRASAWTSAFIAMLFLTGATGLALLLLRATPAMGMLLAVHLGVVFGFFVTMPYGKFVHGIYRFGALVRYAEERRKELSL